MTEYNKSQRTKIWTVTLVIQTHLFEEFHNLRKWMTCEIATTHNRCIKGLKQKIIVKTFTRFDKFPTCTEQPRSFFIIKK